MTTYIALLRAVNVGGTGKLAMADLANACSELGFQEVKTYIQSGNVVFRATQSTAAVREKLEASLARMMGKPVNVIVRTASEMRNVLEGNPFPSATPAKIGVLFLSEGEPEPLLRTVSAPGGEELRRGDKVLYIYYPDGMGKSKLKLPALRGPATMRNINTVAKLVQMAEAIDKPKAVRRAV